MFPFTYIDLFNELIRLNDGRPFDVEVKSFNVFASKLRAQNINCRLSYLDIEEYAESIPQIAQIEVDRIRFTPNKQWIEYITQLSIHFTSSKYTNLFKELWEI